MNRYNTNKDEELYKMKKYREDNHQLIKVKKHQYYKKNKKKIKQYYKDNAERINARKRITNKIRRDSDINYRLGINLRVRLNKALRNNQKSGSAIKDLGCSINELKQHLEGKFYFHPKIGENMTWDNYGIKGWHIDHIIPISAFDLMDREQIKQACHYTNLQPLWAKENYSKSNKMP